MKLINLSLLSLTVLLIFSFSKSSSTTELKLGNKYPGYVETNSGEKIEGYIWCGDMADNQKSCHFYANETDRKPVKKYKPDELKSYKISDVLYRTINYSGGLMNKPLRFLKVSIDGELTMFTFYDESSVPYGQERKTTEVYFKWHDKNFPNPITNEKFAMNFAKKMSEYLADYEELSKKIANKEKGYRLVNMYEIFDEYNKWYKANNQ